MTVVTLDTKSQLNHFLYLNHHSTQNCRRAVLFFFDTYLMCLMSSSYLFFLPPALIRLSCSLLWRVMILLIHQDTQKQTITNSQVYNTEHKCSCKFECGEDVSLTAFAYFFGVTRNFTSNLVFVVHIVTWQHEADRFGRGQSVKL